MSLPIHLIPTLPLPTIPRLSSHILCSLSSITLAIQNSQEVPFCLGRSRDHEKDDESESLGDYLTRPPISAAPGKLMCWWLMSVMLLWQLLLAD